MPAPKKPTHLKVVMGNPGNRPLNKREPIPVGKLKAAPSWMSTTQKEAWDYALVNAPSGLLKMLDQSALVVWVIAQDAHRVAALDIADRGVVTKSTRGEEVINPAVNVQVKQAAIMLRASAELGFSPASRSKIQVSDGEETEDPADKFFN